MRIRVSKEFRKKLDAQIDYIAKDKPIAARRFKNRLFEEIKKIPGFPYSYRRSIFFDNEDVRDLIYKGYVIVFRIRENTIEIFGFFHFQDYRAGD